MRDFSVIAIFERKFFYMSEEIEIKDEVLDLKVTETYDENQIQVLEGLEAVRKRADGEEGLSDRTDARHDARASG